MSDELNYYYSFSKYFSVLTLILFMIYFTKIVIDALKYDMMEDETYVKKILIFYF
jgi:hypothetical protein